jgi:membrane protein
MAGLWATSRALAARAQRFVVAVVRRFYGDHCLLHASALAYTTLLSLVPLFALMFAVLKGLGVQRRLEPLLLSRLALSPDVTQRIILFIDRTNVSTLGALGAAALVLTVLSVLGSVEASLNQIWRVEQSRTWWRKATDYLSVVLLAPFLLLAAVAITSSLQQQQVLKLVLQTEYVGDAVISLLRLAPILINAVALAIIYAVMPNRRQQAGAVAFGAVIAGAAWQLVQWGYVSLQIGVARYNAIYGALSQLPVTLVWLYLSWVVVLAGAELAAVFEFGAGSPEPGSSVSRRAVALQVLACAADRFYGPGGGAAPGDIGRRLSVEPDLVADVCARLAAGGLLVPVAGKAEYVLARDPAAIDLGALEALYDTGEVPRGADERVRRTLSGLASEEHRAWAGRRLADVLSLPSA